MKRLSVFIRWSGLVCCVLLVCIWGVSSFYGMAIWVAGASRLQYEVAVHAGGYAITEGEGLGYWYRKPTTISLDFAVYRVEPAFRLSTASYWHRPKPDGRTIARVGAR